MLDLPAPPPPGPGQLLVEVEAAGVGAWDRLSPGAEWDVGLVPPGALGVEGTGRVLAVGAGVTGFAVGDAVLAHEAPLPGGSGFWSEQILLSADHVTHRPSSVPASTAAALPVSGLTAWQALSLLRLSPGQTLLVTGGAGSTGIVVVQLAVHKGLAVTATASASSERRLLDLGAAEVVDYHDRDWPARVRAGFDGAITVAPGTAVDAVTAVKSGGALCSLTSDAPPAQRDIAMHDLYVAPDAAALADVAALAADGALRLDCVETPLAEGPDVFRRVSAGDAGGHKFVLIP